MLVVKINDLKKMFVTRTVFEQLDAAIAWGEKVAIVGPNGVGKTTLLKMLTGEETPDDGAVVWDPQLDRQRVGLLTQQIQLRDGETVREYVRGARPELLAVEREMRQIETRMSKDISREITAEELVSRYGTLQERYEELGGYTFDSELERVLKEAGVAPEVWETELTAASGGQKTRAQLAKLLLGEPQVLLLDEPTNHLDAETMDWLEAVIRGFAGTVVTVSHDRYFLDRTATRILELSPRQLRSYPGNYSAYQEQKELERRTQQALYQKQQVEMQHLEELIGMYKTWYIRAHNAGGGNKKRTKGHISRMRNKEKQLERLQAARVEQPKEAQSIQLSFNSSEKLGNRLFLVEDMAVRFGGRTLYEEVNFAVERGERIALLGPNGIGKSTLLKVLTGELVPAAGTVNVSPQVRIGYFGQEVERLNPENSILEEVLELETLTQTEARTVLAGFMFRGEAVFKKVGTLSQGEKCRVAFVKLYFSGANVLVLDEPTNYLDIPARQRVEQALQNFPGTLLLVSHDRYMVQRLATQLLLFTPGRVTHFAGGWQAWQEHQERRRYTPEDLQRQEQRMILQLELSRLAEKLDNPHSRPEDRELAAAKLTLVQGQLRALS
ncbi:ATP-binding cassette subfamily F protein 3 [Tumebacillus sp. BK434]|uniref:ribosomal protection-like ABC-F family protein n=1 Tax=Tumebacillus sp. BK434 TaxID=2512169 RepID=UPI0010DBC1B5|nr:ABC-F type ribosomal protection protein [Tumebacillus sp. BK434]TCP52425.1 ATP-binding cassette subfamily F protein 3 [Tumebacillus sp. BK434]